MGLQLTKAWDTSALVSGLKSTSLANAPKAVSDLFCILLGWIAASLVLLASSSPIVSLVGGFIPSIAGYLTTALAAMFPGISIVAQSMTLTKAWDTSALWSALKASEVPDLELIVNNDATIALQWVSQSLALGSKVEQLFAPAVSDLQSIVTQELTAFESKL